jgi:hypothetical protein
MPFDVIAAPCPPTLVIFSVVEPVAVPPSTTNLSEAALSPASTVFSARMPLLPT